MDKPRDIFYNIYNKFQKMANASNIQLNLDISCDDSACVSPAIQKNLEDIITSILELIKNGSLTISVDNDKIIIATDKNTVIPRSMCTKLSNDYVKVTSRVGYGTKIKINLTKKQ